MNILRSIAWKNLKRNKKRTVATITGIIVSVALISFIFTLIYSFQDSMIENTKKTIGNYHIHINEATSEVAIKFKQAQNEIEKVGISQTIGAADYETQIYAKQGIRIEAYDETSLLNRDISIIEGRLPQNEREILVSSYLVNNMNEQVKIGDKLNLDVQKVKLTIYNDGNGSALEPDGVEQIVYTITGIIKQTRQEASSNNAYIAITKLEQMKETRPCQVTILLKNPKEENAFYQTLMNTSLKDYISENTELLLWQGGTNEINEKSQLELIGIISIIIVVAITIILIRNSFQISISERMKEFGTLISIGATSKQITKIVLIEGIIYAIVSIPIGLILGIGIVFFSTKGIGNVLENIYGNELSIQFSINAISIFVTTLITLLSIFISCIKPIKEAKKASPVEVIKQNNEITNKDVKINKLKSKLLGIEGELAYKNIKRNKKKYRSTTISISIIMILVIIVSGVIQYVFSIVNNTYMPTNRNLDVGIIYGYEQEDISTVFENFDRIKQQDSIINYSILVSFKGIIKENNKSISIYGCEGNTYEDYIDNLGLKYEDAVKTGILISNNPFVQEGQTLSIIIKNKEYKIPIIKISNLDPYMQLSSFDNPKILNVGNYEKLVISNDMAKTIDIDDERNSNTIGNFSMDMKINSSNPNQLEKEISQFVNPNKIAVVNYNKQKQDAQRLSAIMSIFLYGLLLVVSLIGITNIYNTITANMNLRKREFEILKAMGMSNKQFNKMFTYESVIYGLKSLIAGTLLGIVFSYLVYCIVKANQNMSYHLPFIQIIITIIITILVIHISTKVKWKNL